METKENKTLLYVMIGITILVLGALVYVVCRNVHVFKQNQVNMDIENNNLNTDNIQPNSYDNGSSTTSDNSSDQTNSKTDEEVLKNYDISKISQIILHKSYNNNGDPGYIDKTITDKEVIKKILSKIDDASYKEEFPSGRGLGFGDWFEINYPDNPSEYVFVYDNGPLVINKAVGAGDTGYGKYLIDATTLSELKELINNYTK